MFWTTDIEDLIQIKTKILWSNPIFFFWTTRFQDFIQSDGQNLIRSLLNNWTLELGVFSNTSLWVLNFVLYYLH